MELRVGISQAAIEQWGTNTIGSRTTRTEAYPLPYSEFCLPIVSGKGYVGGLNYGFGVGVTNFGLTSVTIANNSEDSSYRWTGYTYIVVGAQPQWGYQTVHGTNPVTYDLPIPFEEAPFTVAISTGNSGNHASCGGFTKTTIVLRAGTTAGVWDTVGFFIIGCQLQWGMNIHGWVIFPIPFTKFRRLVTNHQGNVFMDSKARESNTLSGFTLDVADNSDQNKDAQWIAIGA